MTMPLDPGQGTTPSADSAGDPAGAVGSQSQSELYQDALNAATTAEESAQHTLDNLYQQGQALGPEPNDTDSITGGPGPQEQSWLKQSQDLDRQIQAASTQLSQAKRNTATVYTKIASDSSTRARTQGQTGVWAAQAQSATAAANYKNSQAALLDAYGAGKDAATIQKLQADAQKAQQDVGLVAQQTQTSASQQALNSARAVQINETTPAILQLDSARTQLYGSQAAAQTARAGLYGAQTNLANARAQLISGPQAQSLLSKAELDAAKAKGLDLTQGATLDKIQSAANLSDARVAQIAANISKSQVLPYNDKTNPTLTVFQPSTGNVTGVPNPGYVNTTLQGINDTDAAISQIQNEISQDTMTPDEGTALISNLRQALQYKALGVTPDQYLQAQNQQAQLGQNLLTGYGNMLDKGQTAASEFLNAAKGVRGFHGQVTPFSTFGQIAQQTYGPLLDKAKQLISQVQPVHDQFSALQAMSQLGQARQLVAQHIQQQGGTPPPGPTDQNAAANATPATGGIPANPTTGVTPQQASAAGLGVGPDYTGNPSITPEQAAAAGLGAQP